MKLSRRSKIIAGIVTLTTVLGGVLTVLGKLMEIEKTCGATPPIQCVIATVKSVLGMAPARPEPQVVLPKPPVPSVKGSGQVVGIKKTEPTKSAKSGEKEQSKRRSSDLA